MSYVLDAIFLLLMIFITFSGISKGFIRAAAEFFGSIFSIIAASWLGGIISTMIYDNFFKQGLYERILDVDQGKSGTGAIANFFGSLPDFVVRFLEMNGITESSLSLQAANGSANLAMGITDVLSPVFIGIIKVFVVIILFILFMFIIKAVASLLSGICKLPLLAQLNGLLGGVFGFLFSVIILWLVIGVTSFVTPMLDSDKRYWLENAIEHSSVTKIIVAINPLDWIFQ